MSGTDCVTLVSQTLDNYIIISHKVRIFAIWPTKRDRIEKLELLIFQLDGDLRQTGVHLSP
jgi:hypothetical protein